MTGTESRSIAWWPVWELLSPHLGPPGSCPILGTPAWVALPDDDPDKLEAILYAALWWVLAEETRQEHLADASKAIADAVDWPALASEYQNLTTYRAARPWMNRTRSAS